jgi:PPOX class probable F420-dependent enzyme
MATDRQVEDPIPDHVVRLFDGKIRLGYMSTARADGHLAVVPVGVLIHEERIRISSHAHSHKVRNLRQDPHIAVCIPDPSNPRKYTMIRGIAQLADDVDRTFITWLAKTHMGVDEYPDEPRDAARTVITIKPVRIVVLGAQGEIHQA